MNPDLHSDGRPAHVRRGDDRSDQDRAGVTREGSPLFAFAARQAKAYRDDVLRARAAQQTPEYASSVVVIPLVPGPDFVTLVPGGPASYPRCVADQFEKGRLTITSIDNGYEFEPYEPGTWAECTVYGPDDHILYHWSAQ